MLSLKGIKKDYVLSSEEVVHALNGVTLNFRKSEFVSILGPSGCGKTTLMNIIGGLDKYTEGDLIIDGVSTKDFADKDWDNYRNKRIGFVFQNYNLIPHLTVLNNVELALTLSGVSIEERKRKAKEALEKVGLGDQINKKPNQLSGGQMQRVAIARALINSPDVLLADEPTGALDTATSEQIMTLMKEVASDKLVIMVTHNPDIANKYSTRLINMVDGVIISDSDPYDQESVRAEAEQPKKVKKSRKDRTAMSFLTALSLSLRNLFTKKGRTILTSIAGSIGIIGIATILSLSNGMNIYISKLSTDTLSSSPIKISETAVDVEAAMDSFYGAEKWDKYPIAKKVFIRKVTNTASYMSTNNITAEYVNYVKENVREDLVNDIIYSTGLTMRIYTESIDTGEMTQVSGSWQQMVKNEFLSTQYEVLEGTLPKENTDLLLFVDEYNRLTNKVLINAGLISGDDERTEVGFEEVIGKEYYIVPNNVLYKFNGTKYSVKGKINFDDAIKVTITGIARLNRNTETGAQSSGIGYTQGLYQRILAANHDSDIVKYMDENPTKNPLTGSDYVSTTTSKEAQRASDYRKYGGNVVPNSISIYAKDFDKKEEIKNILKAYNNGVEEEARIKYTDMSEIISKVLKSMINVISYVLIGFTAISLIVSSVMIGIITYVSVIERTKEIGILRAIGARKKDITSVFNAETFIVGLLAGLIGVVISAILTLPINAIIKALAGVSGIAKLSFWHALLMIAISIGLTVVSGLIPAVGASKKDPVTALRTE